MGLEHTLLESADLAQQLENGRAQHGVIGPISGRKLGVDDARPRSRDLIERESATDRRQSGSTMEPEPPVDGSDDHEPPPSAEDEESNSQATSSKAPRTGKEHVPENDGSGPMRDYQRRVRLFEMSTGIDPEYRAQKLMERLTGAAWQATETLDVKQLKSAQGVEKLLQHLWQELVSR